MDLEKEPNQENAPLILSREEYMKIVGAISSVYDILNGSMRIDCYEKGMVLQKWTEAGMWFRMYDDMTKNGPAKVTAKISEKKKDEESKTN
jgi:hypothetical protein